MARLLAVSYTSQDKVLREQLKIATSLQKLILQKDCLIASRKDVYGCVKWSFASRLSMWFAHCFMEEDLKSFSFVVADKHFGLSG